MRKSALELGPGFGIGYQPKTSAGGGALSLGAFRGEMAERLEA
jgi:hypothetical protein